MVDPDPLTGGPGDDLLAGSAQRRAQTARSLDDETPEDIVTETPSMHELLKDAPTNWGRWGPDDEVGALNFLTNDEVMRGIRSVRSGRVFTLQRMIGHPKGDPVWPGRAPAVRTQILDESS